MIYTAIQILSVIALVSFIILVIKLILSLNKMELFLNKTSSSMDTITKEVQNVSQRTIKLTDEFEEVKEKAMVSMHKIDTMNEEITNISYKTNKYIDGIQNTIKPYEDLARDTYDKIAPPIQKAGSFLTAFSKAFNAFTSRMSRKESSV